MVSAEKELPKKYYDRNRKSNTGIKLPRKSRMYPMQTCALKMVSAEKAHSSYDNNLTNTGRESPGKYMFPEQVQDDPC